MLAETLQRIVENCPGARGAILMGFDGIAVMQYVAPGHEDADIESLAMEYSFRFLDLRKAAKSLELGDVTDITIKADKITLVTRCLSDEYFVAIVLGEPSNMGKGRWMLRASAEQLNTQL